jgi:hypothetical protein
MHLFDSVGFSARQNHSDTKTAKNVDIAIAS